MTSGWRAMRLGAPLVWLAAFAVPCLPAAVEAAPTAKLEKSVFFAGFSTNQKRAAWHIKIERYGPSGPGQYVDHYAVIRVVEAKSNTTLGSYRIGKIVRLDTRGRPIRIKLAKIIGANPLWAEAGRESDWTALENEYQFQAARLSAATTVAIRPDPDVELSARASEEGTVRSTAGGNLLGYILAMATGRRTVLGRYRHEAKVGQRVSSKLEVLTSLNGDYVAVVNRFDIKGADPDQPATLTYGKIVALTESGERGGEGTIWVRTMWGWKEMTPEQERVWRESHTQRVGFAEMMHRMADGSY